MGDLILNEMHRNAIFVFFLMPGRSRIIFLWQFLLKNFRQSIETNLTNWTNHSLNPSGAQLWGLLDANFTSMIFPSKSPSSKISPVGSAQEEEKESGSAARRHATGRIPHVILHGFLGKNNDVTVLQFLCWGKIFRYRRSDPWCHDRYVPSADRRTGAAFHPTASAPRATGAPPEQRSDLLRWIVKMAGEWRRVRLNFMTSSVKLDIQQYGYLPVCFSFFFDTFCLTDSWSLFVLKSCWQRWVPHVLFRILGFLLGDAFWLGVGFPTLSIWILPNSQDCRVMSGSGATSFESLALARAFEYSYSVSLWLLDIVWKNLIVTRASFC